MQLKTLSWNRPIRRSSAARHHLCLLHALAVDLWPPGRLCWTIIQRRTAGARGAGSGDHQSRKERKKRKRSRREQSLRTSWLAGHRGVKVTQATPPQICYSTPAAPPSTDSTPSSLTPNHWRARVCVRVLQLAKVHPWMTTVVLLWCHKGPFSLSLFCSVTPAAPSPPAPPSLADIHTVAAT